MNRFSQIQEAVCAALKQATGFPPGLSILARRPYEVANDVAAALDKQGICLYVMTPKPRELERTYNQIIFVKRAVIVCRIIEHPTLNLSGFDAWDAQEQCMAALQGINPGNMFAAPLTLSEDQPDSDDYDLDLGNGQPKKRTRNVDVHFNAAFQLR